MKIDYSLMYVNNLRVANYSEKNSRQLTLEAYLGDTKVELTLYFGQNSEGFRRMMLAFSDAQSTDFDKQNASSEALF